MISFKLTGATFGAYADPRVIDRCFGLLKNYARGNSAGMERVQVRALQPVVGDHDLRRSVYRGAGGRAILPSRHHDQETHTNRRESVRPRYDSRCRVLWTPK